MPPSAELSTRFRTERALLLDAINDALDEMGAFNITWAKSQRRVKAEMPQSYPNWGEKLIIDIDLDDDGQVTIYSESYGQLALIDYGKNGRNCREFLDGVYHFVEKRTRKANRRRRTAEDYD